MGLLNWFQSNPECPIDPAARQWIDDRWQWLESQFGANHVQKVPVILPNPEFFPEPYDKNMEDARKLLVRLCGYMNINPKSVELAIFDDEAPLSSLPPTPPMHHPEPGKFYVWVEVDNLDDPLGMVATMARELAHIHLVGHGRLSSETEDHEAVADLLTVFLGAGLIAANAALREQSFRESWGVWWKYRRRGCLTMGQYGYTLARFAKLRDEYRPKWPRRLRPDVRKAFHQSMRFLSKASKD